MAIQYASKRFSEILDVKQVKESGLTRCKSISGLAICGKKHPTGMDNDFSEEFSVIQIFF